jgi:ribosomal protein L22
MKKGYTFEITKEMVTAKTTSKISTVHSQLVVKYINGKNFAKAKYIIDGLATEKRGIDSRMGRYYTKTSEGFMKLLKLLEANALNRGMDFDSMDLFICASKGPAYHRGRRKSSFGSKLKVTHLQAVLKPGKKRKVKKVFVKKNLEVKKETPVVKPEIKKEVLKPVENKPEVKPVVKNEPKVEEKKE